MGRKKLESVAMQMAANHVSNTVSVDLRWQALILYCA